MVALIGLFTNIHHIIFQSVQYSTHGGGGIKKKVEVSGQVRDKLKHHLKGH